MTPIHRPVRILAVAAGYFGWVFGSGFVLGVLRTLFVVPRIGERNAELAEMPLMLVVIYLASGWVVRRIRGQPRADAIVVGLSALALALLAELAVGVLLRGLTVSDALLDRDPISGVAFYLSLVVLAAAPAWRGRSRGLAALHGRRPE